MRPREPGVPCVRQGSLAISCLSSSVVICQHPEAVSLLPLITLPMLQALAESLDAAVRESDPYFNKLLRILATRCMTQAAYFGSGDAAPAEYHHYGLAAPLYTHFTSPIRRCNRVSIRGYLGKPTKETVKHMACTVAVSVFVHFMSLFRRHGIASLDRLLQCSYMRVHRSSLPKVR